MGLLKKIQDSNKAGLDYMAKHPVGTGVYGSSLLEKVLKQETAPYIYEGLKKGYEQASAEYEKKLLEQADMFLKQKEQMQAVDKKKEELLEELLGEIERLDNKVKLTEEENRYLQELLLREHKLRKL